MPIAPSKLYGMKPADADYLNRLDQAFRECRECERLRRVNTNLWLTLEETGHANTKLGRERRFKTQQTFFAFGAIAASLIWWLVKAL